MRSGIKRTGTAPSSAVQCNDRGFFIILFKQILGGLLHSVCTLSQVCTSARKRNSVYCSEHILDYDHNIKAWNGVFSTQCSNAVLFILCAHLSFPLWTGSSGLPGCTLTFIVPHNRIFHCYDYRTGPEIECKNVGSTIFARNIMLLLW